MVNTINKNRLPGAIGAGLFRGATGKPHSWSGNWHMRPRKKLSGPAESFALEPRSSAPRENRERQRDEAPAV